MKKLILVLFVVGLSFIQSPTVLAQTSSNLVLDMTFDNDTPPTVLDNSQYHNNGILHGVTLGSNDCFSGNCYTFDGATNYIEVPNTPSLNPTTITISAWIKPQGKGSAGGPEYLGVIGKGSSYAFLIRQDSTILMYLTGVNNWVTGSANKKNLFDGIWHHLVATYDGVNQKIYIDGTLISSTSATGSISSSPELVKVGESYKGQMDNVRVYNKGLSAQEITQLYASYGEVRTSPRTYYVSSGTGNDNNDGLSQSTPWRTLEKIFKETAHPGRFVPGDSILLKRGNTWTGHIGLGTYKGELNNLPITIGAYDTGSKPIIYGDGRGLTWTTVAGYPGVYETSLDIGSIPGWVYEGNNIQYNYSQTPFSLAPGSWGTPFASINGREGNLEKTWIRTLDGNSPHNMRVFLPAIVDVDKSENIIVENLDLRETIFAVYVSYSDSIIIRDIDTLNTQDVSIYFETDTNSIMDHNNAVNSGNSVFYIFGGSNNTIRNSSLFGVYNTISGIYTPDSDNAGIGLQESRGNIIEYNKLLSGGMDYYKESNSIVRYNFFQYIPGSFEGGGGQAGSPYGNNNIFYGNIVDGRLGANGGFNAGGSSRIFHNTFYNVVAYSMMAAGPSVGAGPIIRNNLIIATGATQLTTYGANVDSDNNCFYATAPYSSAPHFASGTYPDEIIYQSLSSFQQGTGHDLHSVYGDPKIDPITYKLASDSPCKDMGADLSSLINFPYKDYLGVTIPQGSAPDAGAFEFVSTSGDTTPPVISGVSASALTTSVATIAWTTNENSDTQVEYGLTTTYGNSTTLNTSLVTSHSATISGLTAGTLYHYRVKSRDAAGNLATSADYIFTTTPGPDTTPPTVSITAPTNNSTVSGLTVAVSATASDNVGVVGVQFKLDGANLGAEDTSSPYGTTWNTTTATNTSHALSAVGRDAAGNSTTSTAVTVIVNNIIPPATPPTVTSLQPISGPIGTSVTLTGTNFTPTGNRVKFGDLGSENNPNYSLNSANGTTLVFPVPAGNYYACWVATPLTPVCNVPAYSTSPGIYQVSIINSRGASNAMPFTVTTTPGTQTPTISNVQINSIKRSSAIVIWNTNIPTNGQVEYGLTTAYGQVTPLSSTLSISHNALVNNLLPNTNYFFRIKSKDISGNPAPHNGSTFKTLSRLEKPPQLTLLGAEKGSVILNWGSIDYDLCQSIKVYRSTTDFVATPVDSSLLATLTCSGITYHDEAVTPSTKYYYSLFTVDDQGVFSDPAHISFTTEPRSTSGGRYTPPPSTPPTVVCSSGQMFSPTTGARCTSFTQPVSCLSGQMFNPTTGERCNTTISSPYVPPVTPGVSVYNFGPITLKNGSRGEAVMELQRFLNKALNLTLVVDGILGPKTTLFIKYWQTANGLVADGLVGAKTKAKMNAQ